MTENEVNFNKEFAELMSKSQGSKENRKWLDITVEGSPFIVKFEDDGVNYIGEYNNKPQEKVRYKVLVESEPMMFSMTKASTFKSIYGQIIACGNKMGGLAGKTLTLSATWDDPIKKDKRVYVVEEAKPIIAEIVATLEASEQNNGSTIQNTII